MAGIDAGCDQLRMPVVELVIIGDGLTELKTSSEYRPPLA